MAILVSIIVTSLQEGHK